MGWTGCRMMRSRATRRVPRGRWTRRGRIMVLRSKSRRCVLGWNGRKRFFGGRFAQTWRMKRAGNVNILNTFTMFTMFTMPFLCSLGDLKLLLRTTTWPNPTGNIEMPCNATGHNRYSFRVSLYPSYWIERETLFIPWTDRPILPLNALR